MVKCVLDDGRPAYARVKAEDGSRNHICLEHLFQFRSSDPEMDIIMMKGRHVPPMNYKDESHEWRKGNWYSQVEDEYQCEKCGLTMMVMMRPADSAFGGCIKQEDVVEWRLKFDG